MRGRQRTEREERRERASVVCLFFSKSCFPNAATQQQRNNTDTAPQLNAILRPTAARRARAKGDRPVTAPTPLAGHASSSRNLATRAHEKKKEKGARPKNTDSPADHHPPTTTDHRTTTTTGPVPTQGQPKKNNNRTVLSAGLRSTLVLPSRKTKRQQKQKKTEQSDKDQSTSLCAKVLAGQLGLHAA